MYLLGVSCGGHFEDTCRECHSTKKSWCNGDCEWRNGFACTYKSKQHQQKPEYKTILFAPQKLTFLLKILLPPQRQLVLKKRPLPPSTSTGAPRGRGPWDWTAGYWVWFPEFNLRIDFFCKSKHLYTWVSKSQPFWTKEHFTLYLTAAWVVKAAWTLVC